MDYFKIAQAVFILIVFIIAVAAVWYFMLQILFKAATYFIKWLLGYKAVANLIDRIRRGVRKWYKKYKKYFISLWDFFSEIYLDPLFYGYALYALVTRIQSISDYAKVHPQYSFWQLLDLDTRTDTSFYLIFIAIFTLWMVWKSWKHREEVRFKRTLLKKLVSIEKAQKTLLNKRREIRRGKKIGKKDARGVG